MTSWKAPSTCTYTAIYLGATDDNGNYKSAVPLTTVFTPPVGCRLPLQNLGSTACWPEPYYEVWYAGGFFSPGLCPSDYTVGCTAGKSTQILNGVVVKASETAAICVPR